LTYDCGNIVNDEPLSEKYQREMVCSLDANSEHHRSRWRRDFVYSEYDVVAIGAGDAGIGAGRILRERGANYCLLEAKARLGGRA
jgi:NADPH-dependent 2,4-dienoyl-CoA reductase/sulfur reductase-like enzyme